MFHLQQRNNFAKINNTLKTNTMKNLILSLSIVALTLTSCSKSDDAPAPMAGGPMPSKIVSTYTGGQVSTSTFTYSGNKILEENIVPTSDFSRIKYTYTGDNITKMDLFTGPTFSPAGGTTFTYENGKLKTSIELTQPGFSGPLRKNEYTYNSDGTIVTETGFFINQSTGVVTPIGRQMRYTYASGLLLKTESISGGVVGQVTNYTNETGKNQAFKNVLGYDQTAAEGNLRLSTVYVGSSNPGETFTYSYNANNYPSQVVQPNAFGTQSKTQVFTYQ